MTGARKQITEWLDKAGITVNGDQKWDIQIRNNNFFDRVMQKGSLGLGETYMDGWWDVEKLDSFFYKILDSKLDHKVSASSLNFLAYLKSILTNPQRKQKAFQIGQEHYDIGNDVYEVMLDKRLVYTCGYWEDALNLDEAQENKLKKVCNTLNLKPGQKILDIGCGWGSLAKYATSNWDVSVVGITVSENQVELARERCKKLPVEIRLLDYRDINEKFDHIVSLGMFEHVGYKNYSLFMQIVYQNLNKDGKFILHTIGGNKSVSSTDPWINRYIFPNSMIPSIKQIGESIENLFIMENWENHGLDYDKTLMQWYKNFKDGWPTLKVNYSHRFYRMWEYYLLSCAGSFRARRNQQWNIVLRSDFEK